MRLKNAKDAELHSRLEPLMFICVLHAPQKLSAGALSGHGLVESAAPLFWEARALGTVQSAGRKGKKSSRKHAKAKPFAHLEA